LSGCVENLVHHRLSVVILFRKNLRRDFNQETVQFALIPVPEYLGELIWSQAQPILQQLVCLTDQLHIAILNAVMHHLHVMPRAVLADPVAAWSLINLRRDSLEDFLHVRPRFLVAPRHN
jgi:hypothetical protein